MRRCMPLLLEYTSFRVRTIDSFFQEVVRSFAYELGHAGALRVQLDSDQLLHQAVLEVLARQDQEKSDEKIEAWLQELTTEAIEDGKGYNIETSSASSPSSSRTKPSSSYVRARNSPPKRRSRSYVK